MKTDSNEKNPEPVKQSENIAKNDAAVSYDQDPKDSSAEFAPYPPGYSYKSEFEGSLSTPGIREMIEQLGGITLESIMGNRVEILDDRKEK